MLLVQTGLEATFKSLQAKRPSIKELRALKVFLGIARIDVSMHGTHFSFGCLVGQQNLGASNYACNAHAYEMCTALWTGCLFSAIQLALVLQWLTVLDAARRSPGLLALVKKEVQHS